MDEAELELDGLGLGCELTLRCRVRWHILDTQTLMSIMPGDALLRLVRDGPRAAHAQGGGQGEVREGDERPRGRHDGALRWRGRESVAPLRKVVLRGEHWRCCKPKPRKGQRLKHAPFASFACETIQRQDSRACRSCVALALSAGKQVSHKVRYTFFVFEIFCHRRQTISHALTYVYSASTHVAGVSLSALASSLLDLTVSVALAGAQPHARLNRATWTAPCHPP